MNAGCAFGARMAVFAAYACVSNGCAVLVAIAPLCRIAAGAACANGHAATPHSMPPSAPMLWRESVIRLWRSDTDAPNARARVGFNDVMMGFCANEAKVAGDAYSALMKTPVMRGVNTR